MSFKTIGSRFAAAIASVSVLGLWAGSAHAGVVDEISVGWYAHDFVNISDGVESNLQDAQFEIDSKRPQILRFLGAPRLNLVATVNGPGHSDVFGGGLVWDHRLLFRQLFVTLDFGLAYSNGVIGPPRNLPASDPDGDHYPRLLLGSPVLFRTVPGIEWKLNDRWVIGGQLIHLSNGGVLGSHHFNRGINDLGVKVGYRFQ